MSVKKYLGETSLASLWAKIKALIPTKTSDLTNDSGYLTSYTETDPTVPSWAKASTKPSYTASEVGALPDNTTYVSSFNGSSGAITYTAPVTSVNGETGAVTVADEKVKYTPLTGSDTVMHGFLFAEDKGNTERTATVYSGRANFKPSEGKFTYYNGTGSRAGSLSYKELTLANDSTATGGTLKTANVTASRTYTLPDKDGTVAMTSDIPTVPTNVSAFTNDAGYLTSYTETDPTVPSWAKESTKPTYTASEVGAATSTHTHGNITNGGDITTTATIASGDRLVINDESESKVTNSSITFGDLTTTFLANNGTWKTPTDTKVTATALNGENSTRGLLFASNSGSTTTDTVATSNKLTYSDYQTPTLCIYNSSRTKYAILQYNNLYIADASSANYRGKLKTLYGLTADRTYTFPDQSGTVALISDIPTVPTKTSDLTNDSGYLTLATLPVYDGSYSAITS